MYVVKRKEFMEALKKQKTLVYGCVYGCSIEGIIIAYYDGDNDFIMKPLDDNIDCDDIADFYDWTKDGTHFTMDIVEGTSREGIFDEKKKYAIYEKSDLETLINELKGALESYE